MTTGNTNDDPEATGAGMKLPRHWHVRGTAVITMLAALVGFTQKAYPQ